MQNRTKCPSGTGLSDGYPPGDVDGHEVSFWYVSRISAETTGDTNVVQQVAPQTSIRRHDHRKVRAVL